MTATTTTQCTVKKTFFQDGHFSPETLREFGLPELSGDIALTDLPEGFGLGCSLHSGELMYISEERRLIAEWRGELVEILTVDPQMFPVLDNVRELEMEDTFEEGLYPGENVVVFRLHTPQGVWECKGTHKWGVGGHPPRAAI